MSYPALKKSDINLAVKIDVESGNPYRTAGGKFGSGIPGVKFYSGEETFKSLPKETKDATIQRVLASGANSVGMRLNGGKVSVVVLKDGRVLDSFDIPLGDYEEMGTNPNEENSPENKSFAQLTVPERDAIVDAARNLDLEGNALYSFIEERLNVTLSAEAKVEIEELIEKQRLEDLIAYLHSNLEAKANPSDNSATVRIRTPRGFLRKTFARLDKDQASEVIQRVQARGHNEQEIQNGVVAYMPKRLKEIFERQFVADRERDNEDEGE